MTPGARGDDGASSFSREIDWVKDKLDSTEDRVEKMNAVLIDAQVRLAQLEAVRMVSHDEFEPVKRLVWGAVGTILTLTLIAMLALVLNKTGTTIGLKAAYLMIGAAAA